MFKNLDVKEIACTCNAGAEIGECLREAALLALNENRAVTFSHNGTTYHVSPNAIIVFLHDNGEKAKRSATAA
jgi:hypothetical protein